MPLYRLTPSFLVERCSTGTEAFSTVWKPFFEDHWPGCTCTVTDNEMLIKFSFTSIQMKMVSKHIRKQNGVYKHYNLVTLSADSWAHSWYLPDTATGNQYHDGYTDIYTALFSESSSYPTISGGYTICASPDGSALLLLNNKYHEHAIVLAKTSAKKWVIWNCRYANCFHENDPEYRPFPDDTCDVNNGSILAMFQTPDTIQPGVYRSIFTIINSPNASSVEPGNVIEIGDEQYCVFGYKSRFLCRI